MSPDDKAELLEILEEVWGYLDDRADVDVSGDPLTEHPNEAMSLLGRVEGARRIIEKEIS